MRGTADAYGIYNMFKTGMRSNGRQQQGFTLVESVVAMGVTTVALLGFYASEQQAARIAQIGRAHV